MVLGSSSIMIAVYWRCRDGPQQLKPPYHILWRSRQMSVPSFGIGVSHILKRHENG